MTTLLDRPEQPATAASTTRGTDARRAIVRWAWRLYRREWRQQILALALLIVAVSATIVGLGVVSNVVSTDAAVFGTAATRVDIGLSTPDHLAPDLARARQVFGTVDPIVHGTVPVPGSVNPVDLRDQSPYGPYGRPMLRLVSGHYPISPDEVALTHAAAATFGVHIGSTWAVNGRTAHVVGIVENPKDLQDDFVLVAPGTITKPTSVTILSTGTSTQIQAYRPMSDDSSGVATTGASAPEQRRQQSLAVLLLATIGLIFVGLLSVAGFTVMAHRRMRALGMVRSVGATDRQVRLVLLANGAVVGVVGAVVGAAVGLLVWIGLVPTFEHAVGHRIDAFAIQWWAVVAMVLLAILTAILSAWWPARAVARLPIVTALSGRPAPPQPAHRFAALGVGSAALGFVLLASAHERNSLLIVLGIVTTVIGMLLIAPLSMRVLSRLATRTPIAVRLALRDLARYQARSGAALAAVSLAIGIAATIAITASAQAAADHSHDHGNLPPNQLEVWIAGPPGPGGKPGVTQAQGSPEVSTQQAATLQQAVTALAAALHTDRVLLLAVSSNSDAQLPNGGVGPFDTVLVNPVPHGYKLSGVPFVATPELLHFYGIPASAIAGAGALVGSSDSTNVAVLNGINRGADTPVVCSNRLLPKYTSAPHMLISPEYMAAHGLRANPVGWLIQTPHPLTTDQITTARHAALQAGMTIETRSAPDRSQQRLRDYATAIGVLVALGILAMTVGLIRSETANDLRTLSATGAAGRTRRTITGSTACALALLGGVIGTAGAYVALIAWRWHDISYLNHPPYANLAILVLGLPAIALAGGWLAAWRAPQGIAHRPME